MEYSQVLVVINDLTIMNGHVLARVFGQQRFALLVKSLILGSYFFTAELDNVHPQGFVNKCFGNYNPNHTKHNRICAPCQKCEVTASVVSVSRAWPGVWAASAMVKLIRINAKGRQAKGVFIQLPLQISGGLEK
jgi:hypothetical protein